MMTDEELDLLLNEMGGLATPLSSTPAPEISAEEVQDMEEGETTEERTEAPSEMVTRLFVHRGNGSVTVENTSGAAVQRAGISLQEALDSYVEIFPAGTERSETADLVNAPDAEGLTWVGEDAGLDSIDEENGEEDSEEETISEPEVVVSNIIPDIPQSVYVDDATVRFSGAAWFEAIKNINIFIAGIGGIGSWTSLLIARLNPQYIKLVDFDTVDTVNLAGQLFGRHQVGKSKVHSMTEIMRVFTNTTNISPISTRITGDDYLAEKVVICGFDNMVARKTLFTVWKNRISRRNAYENAKDFLFIDGRMNAEEFQIFTITGDDDFNIKRYEEEFLFDDSEVEAAVCSYKQTTFCASMIGSFITNTLVNFVSNTIEGSMPRALPFYISYDAKLMYFKTED